ncbi:Glycosyl transferase group 1 [Candidatus Sulfobium mesophilum]|uniref:Glycosyl transferase group 1 n=1 Tax=Candidatus Sulfobium mesophilum TaxID=2016548 RepID=A0A2U3QDZ1_9BACT|nr:Glycosyl transferase group 1 [Candidatus Sulfobium mesophilum]
MLDGKAVRIGINALYLLPGRVGGSEIYIRNLVKHLAGTGGNNAFVIFTNQESAGAFDDAGPGVEIVLCPIQASSRPVRILWEQLVLPFQILRHKIDILFSAGMTAPLLCPIPSVLAIFDLLHVLQPQNFPRVYLLFLKTIIYLSAKSADGIVTISRKVMDDILKFYRVPGVKIAVTYLAVDHNTFFPREAKEVEDVRAKYSLPERFILYAAASLPHKNHARLFEALRILKERGRGTALVLTGARDKGYDAVAQIIRKMGLETDVVFTGWLPFEDIAPIYCASDALVFPSLNEGFGMPIIEAMACGVPVTCSSIEPLPEVAGDAAYYFDPYDPVSIADGITAVISDSDLRRVLIEKGFRRAAKFSWENTALQTLEFIMSYGEGSKN